jgi:transposase
VHRDSGGDRRAGQCGHDVPRAAAPGPTPQKKSLHASERDTPRIQQARQDYRQKLTAFDLRRLKFVDESSVNLAMTRRYGRAPTGQRVLGSIPQNYGPNVTMLGALGVHGLHAVMTVDGATDADVFRTYVRQVLGPTLTPGDIVVMDNLRAHKAIGVQQALARRGARLLYLPPYSPDLAPIEPCWSKVKTALRTAKARTRGALDTAIAAAMGTISLADAYGWFKHCGYPLQ